MNKKMLAFVTLMISQTGCALSKDSSHGVTAPGGGDVPISSLALKPEDWTIRSSSTLSGSVSQRTLKPDKLEWVRKRFTTPRLDPVTLTESNGFELYELGGYSDLADTLFIHPKLYLNTTSAQGSVMGYRTGLKDSKGADLIEISIPVALVNGLVPAVGSIALSSGDRPFVTLPSQFQIPDVEALKVKSGKKVSTLPVCPDMFKLVFENREYWAKSPFEGLSNCPLNQFYRVKFQAPMDEMNRLLEAASIRDGAVTLVASLSVGIDVPRLITDLKIEAQPFKAELIKTLASEPTQHRGVSGKRVYLISEIESAILSTLFSLGESSGYAPRYSSSLLAETRRIALSYFGRPSSCGSLGACSSLNEGTTPSDPIEFSWQEREPLLSTLRTETVSALGSVANSNPFMSKPSRDQLAKVRRPAYFKFWDIDLIAKRCTELMAEGWPGAYDHKQIDYGADSEEVDHFRGYCAQIAGNSAILRTDPEQNDGYFPFITSSTVYPGAWIKIDIKNISELTTATTHKTDDGREVVESEIKDLLSIGSKDPKSLTSCVSGDQIACSEYEKEISPTLDSRGDIVFGEAPCRPGEDGCAMSEDEDGKSRWAMKVPLTHETLKYDCSAGVETTYCPYLRAREEIVGYDISYTCQDEKTKSKTTFLCFGGCSEEHEMVCKESARKPVLATREYLMCKGYDGGGDLPPKKSCSNPKYLCAKWNTNCTRYSVNEAFQVAHEGPVPKWRSFSIDAGEFPQRFEEDLYLKFISPGSVVTNCPLRQFEREIRGGSLFIKLPSADNEGIVSCDGQPLWNEVNTRPNALPKVYLKNEITYQEQRKCGKTEYSFLTKEVPLHPGSSLVPRSFSYQTQTHVGPVEGSCRQDSPFRVGDDLWFTDTPLIRFSGQVSVLGRVLESIVTEKVQ